MLIETDKTLVDVDEDQKVDRVGQLTEEILKEDTSKTRTQHVIKAHISSLVSALGGPDHTSEAFPPPYRLGVNAYAVLKDLKRWLKFDKSCKKWDVALAVGETSLVTNDLLWVLCDWNDSYLNGQISAENKVYKDRIACLCLELLVPLTWPLQLVNNESTINQVTNYHKLKTNQLRYKKALLGFRNGAAFEAVIRIVIPIVSLPKHKRTTRDDSVLNLCVLFLRNVLAIEPETVLFALKAKARSNKSTIPTSALPADVSNDDVSLSTVISVFHNNKVLKFLITLFAGLGKEFDDKVLGFGSLECLYYLTSGVKVSALLARNSGTEKAGSELGELLQKENKLKTRFIKESASRHSRFGSLLSLDTKETGRLTISGQKALLSAEKTMERLNASKKWKTTGQRIALQAEDVNEKVKHLLKDSQEALGGFAETFVDGGFNQFVAVMGKKFLGTEVVDLHCIQYCMVSAWFLEFERLRRNSVDGQNQAGQVDDMSEYGLIASVLVADNIRLLKVFLNKEEKAADVSFCHAGIIVFKEILLLLNDMSQSKIERDVDVAIGTLKSIFTDDLFLKSLSTIAKQAQNKNLRFIMAVVDFLDICFKTLQHLSKEDKLVIVNRKSAKKTLEEDQIQGVRRKFKLKLREFRFADFFHSFINESTINTYLRLFKQYDSVDLIYLRKALHFFHKVYFAYKQHTYLLRLDFLALVHDILGPQNRSVISTLRPEFEDFFKYYMKSLRHHLEQTPSLAVELLFPKFHDSVQYFNTGERSIQSDLVSDVIDRTKAQLGDNLDPDERESIINQAVDEAKEDAKNRRLKPAREIEFKSSKYSVEEKIGILAYFISSKNKKILEHLNSELKSMLDQWKNDSNGTFPTMTCKDTAMKKEFLKNAPLRLLLKTIGFEVPVRFGGKCQVVVDGLEIYAAQRTLEYYLKNPYILKAEKTLSAFTKPVDQDLYYTDVESASDSDLLEPTDTTPELEDAKQAYIEWCSLIKKLRHEQLEIKDRILCQKRIEQLASLAAQYEKTLVGPQKTHSTRRKRTLKRKIDLSDTDELEKDKPKKKKIPTAVVKYSSAMYIESSEDESDNEADKLFFEKEKRLRQLIDRNGGLISKTQYEQFTNDFSAGTLPSYEEIESVKSAEIISKPQEETHTDLDSSTETPEFEETPEPNEPSKSKDTLLYKELEGQIIDNSNLKTLKIHHTKLTDLDQDSQTASAVEDASDDEETIVVRRKKTVIDDDDD